MSVNVVSTGYSKINVFVVLALGGGHSDMLLMSSWYVHSGLPGCTSRQSLCMISNSSLSRPFIRKLLNQMFPGRSMLLAIFVSVYVAVATLSVTVAVPQTNSNRS